MKTHILNKINQLNNRNGKIIENILLMYKPENYLSDEVFDIELEVDDDVKVPARLKRQIGYLNKYLVKYNKKHGTSYNVKLFVFWE
jgi:hypothetical protein